MKKREVYCLQPTATFPEGAPQREEFDDDAAHDAACLAYAAEWRNEYVCPGCNRIECPYHGGQGATDHERREAELERLYAESLIAAVDGWLIANDDHGRDGDWREALRWVIERDGLPS